MYSGLLSEPIHYSFLNPSETITSEKNAQQINEMHRNCKACSQHWSTERAGFFCMTVPHCALAQLTFQKLNKLGCDVLPHLPYSPAAAATAKSLQSCPILCDPISGSPPGSDLLPNDYHFFKHLDDFLQGKCFHNQQEAENAFQEFAESQSMDFYAAGINQLISCWQKCVDCNGSYFD